MKFLTIEETESLILDALKNRTPFSLVRLGDGEGLLLDYDGFGRSEHLRYVFACQLRKWFGFDSLLRKDLETIRRQLKQSVAIANIVGIPSGKGRLWRRARDVISKQRLIKKSHGVVSANQIHIDLHVSGALARIMRAADEITLVTCRKSVVEDVERISGKPVRLIQIPEPPERLSEQKEIASFGHWEQRGKIREKCYTDHAHLVLVGAGVMGKMYCTDAMRGGSVAIDIGSIFDGWAGVSSRSYLRNNPDVFTLTDKLNSDSGGLSGAEDQSEIALDEGHIPGGDGTGI